MSNILDVAKKLLPGQSIGSGPYALNLRSDGNLTFTKNGKVLWNAQVNGGTGLLMAPDGNLVLLDAAGKTVWQSGTHIPNSYLIVGDGYFAVCAQGGKKVWTKQVEKKASLFPDPIKAAKDVGHAAGNLAHGKISRAAGDLGRAANQIAGSQIIQAAFPGSAIPASVLAGAVSGGPKGALDAAHAVAKNPALKGVISATGVVFPPLAPVSAGAVAGLEASGRLLDGLDSKDPKAIAAAALQIASTTALAASGSPGAQRAIDTVQKVQAARDLAGRLAAGDSKAATEVAALTSCAASGNAKAKDALSTFHAVTARESLRGKLPASAAHAIHTEAPSLLSMVGSALNTPSGVKVGDFTVLRTGRILHRGSPIKRNGA